MFKKYQFDPFPYTFLTLVVSLEAIFLSTFILISRNHETRVAERRNHLDLQINLLSEAENTKMLRLLVAISEAMGIETEDDLRTEAFVEQTKLKKMIGQIREISEREVPSKD